MLPPTLYAPSIAHFLSTMVRALFSPALGQTHVRWLRLVAAASLVAILALFVWADATPFAPSLIIYYLALTLSFWLSIGLIIYLQAIETTSS